MKYFDSFGLDTANECLWREGARIPLAPKPFAVLRYLVENPNRLVTHDELLDALWPETYVQPQVLRTYVLELRKVLGDDARQPRFIESQPKRGYIFIASITEEQGRRRGAPIATRVGGIVGRETELGTLRQYFLKLMAGTRQVLFVTGGTGIGKTALVDTFCHQLDPAHAPTVASGHCVQGLDKKEHFYPVMEALAQICASPEGEKACSVLARMAPVWLASLGREAPDAQRKAQERTPGDLCAALEELALDKPLILVFEDIHWADDSTLNLISALARRKSQTRLMVLGTNSPHAGPAEQSLRRLKQDLLMHRLAREIMLAPLGRVQLTELLCCALGQENLPPGLDSFVHEHSEGNPLFAIAILEHLIVQRFLINAGLGETSRWEQRAPFQEMEAGVPDELAQMIELEIEGLNEREQHILEAGSLFNVAFPAWAVAAAIAEEMSSAEEECDALARRLHYVKRAGQDELPDGTTSTFYVFAHGLYREVLYQRQSATRRSRGHSRIAERLSELFRGREADVAREIAMHHEAAGNWLRAIESLRAAAQGARARDAHGMAEEIMLHVRRINERLTDADRESAVQEVLASQPAAIGGFDGRNGQVRKSPQKFDNF